MFAGLLPVFALFLDPIGAGIPAGVLLAQKLHQHWAVTAFLYFVTDVLLALVFEPIMLLFIALGRRVPFLLRVGLAMQESTKRTAALYGGPGAGPVTLVLIAFGIDPMTGRAAARAAGHGFFGGWAVAITGDMMYYGVVAAVTLKLSSTVKDPTTVVALVLLGMFMVPALARRAKAAWDKRPRRSSADPATL